MAFRHGICRCGKTGPPLYSGRYRGKAAAILGGFIHPNERNPRFTNPLAGATSPYLKQHAHNPVFWYPWGKEAIERARSENKPILLSIGYSTCYWCHVMEREVFENLSIASLMNRTFINIKVDREEHPELDEIYMVARQLMTHEGGWPNNVFLTPDLKPFYAGGTYLPEDTQGKPGFPRLLEWLHYAWTTQEATVRQNAEEAVETMQNFLHAPASSTGSANTMEQARALHAFLDKHYDTRSGGFFQAPKFPHESYLLFLMQYFETTGDAGALGMATHSLAKMSAGGIYDQVACGFHRYAVDKEWYVPHFEKMLYNQALLARAFTEAARLSSNEYYASVARGVLDFVSGPLTSGSGAFYAAIDAETDGVEGAYYAWTAEEIESILTPEEVHFFTNFYALADIPAFPGHKHAKGQVIIARQPLDIAAKEKGLPFMPLAARAGTIMNRLLAVRNARQSPGLDDKIITGWNGMMIDAFAYAGQTFGIARYTDIAKKAAAYLLEHAINKESDLCRVIVGGKSQLAATLEDYAFFIKGLLSLHQASGEASWLEAAQSLFERADELFLDATPGYFYAQPSDYLIARIKSADDSAIPSANAVMAANLVTLYGITKKTLYRDKATAIFDAFLAGKALQEISGEHATLLQAALLLHGIENKAQAKPYVFSPQIYKSSLPSSEIYALSAALVPDDIKPGEVVELRMVLRLNKGWHIHAHTVSAPYLIPTQLDVFGEGLALEEILYPDAQTDAGGLPVYEGNVRLVARFRLQGERKEIKAWLRFQPCNADSCQAVQDLALTF